MSVMESSEMGGEIVLKVSLISCEKFLNQECHIYICVWNGTEIKVAAQRHCTTYMLYNAKKTMFIYNLPISFHLPRMDLFIIRDENSVSI